MTSCYACEYKEYREGNQIPNSNCPLDCTILTLLGYGYQSGSQGTKTSMENNFPELKSYFHSFDGSIKPIPKEDMDPKYKFGPVKRGLLEEHGKPFLGK